MSERPYFPKTTPDIYAAIRDLAALVESGGPERGGQERGALEKSLIELVKIRASQINGCAFCLDMHTREARKHGETEQRIYLLNAWRETPYFSARERAALAWTECLTRLATDGAPDAAYRELADAFSPVEIATLTAVVGVINTWNRIAVGLNWPMPRAVVSAA